MFGASYLKKPLIRMINVGPITEADIKLEPLTIFIGPNNVGKSYVAATIHALKTGIYEGIRRAITPRIIFEFRKRKKERLDVQIIKKEFWPSCTKSVGLRLEHSFGSSIDDIINVDASNIRIEIIGRSFKGFMEFHKGGGVKSDCEVTLRKGQKNISPSRLVIEPMPSFFLPAARSGILQAHKAIAAVITELSPLMPIRGVEIPKLSGVTAKFIHDLLMVAERPISRFRRPLLRPLFWEYLRFIEITPEEYKEFDKKLLKLLNFMENELLKGTIKPRAPHEKLAPDFFYRSIDGRIEVPLYRASSMVSELAPLYIYLKYVIPGPSFLIIEEPESHLHPEAQAIIARLLVKLIRIGFHILITTHSDHILGQLSNHIALSTLTPDERKKLGYEDDEWLKPSEVSAYLFKFKKKRAVTERLRVTEEGIPDEELTKVAEEIYGTYTRIHYHKQLKTAPR